MMVAKSISAPSVPVQALSSSITLMPAASGSTPRLFSLSPHRSLLNSAFLAAEHDAPPPTRQYAFALKVKFTSLVSLPVIVTSAVCVP